MFGNLCHTKGLDRDIILPSGHEAGPHSLVPTSWAEQLQMGTWLAGTSTCWWLVPLHERNCHTRHMLLWIMWRKQYYIDEKQGNVDLTCVKCHRWLHHLFHNTVKDRLALEGVPALLHLLNVSSIVFADNPAKFTENLQIIQYTKKTMTQ